MEPGQSNWLHWNRTKWTGSNKKGPSVRKDLLISAVTAYWSNRIIAQRLPRQPELQQYPPEPEPY
jgi:hypothetical protein